MTASSLDDLVELARTFRSHHPDQLTFAELTLELTDRSGTRVPRAALRTRLVETGGFDEWIVDLLETRTSRQAGALLEDWIGASEDRRTDLGREVAASFERDPSAETLRPTAVALGAVDGTVDWSMLGHESVPPDFVPHVLRAAAAADRIDLIIRTALFAPEKQSKVGREILSEADSDRISEAVRMQLASWITSPPPGADLNAATKRLARVLPAETGLLLCTDLLRLASREPIGGTREEWRETLAGLALADEPEKNVRAIDELEPDLLEALLRALVRSPFGPATVRGRIILAVANGSAADVLLDPSLWGQVPADDAGWFLGELDASVPLHSRLEKDLLGPLVGRSTASMRTSDVFGLVGRWPRTLDHVDVAAVLRGATRSDAGSLLLRRLLDEVRSEIDAAIARSREEARAASDRAVLAEERLAASQAETSSLRRQVEESEERLREVAGSHRGAHQAELRQARFDVLRQLVELAEALRAAARSPESVLAIHRDVVRILEAHGIAVVGSVGDQRPLDPAIDSLAGDGADLVEVVAPAYVINDNPVTPLRHAVVRPIHP